MKSDSRTYPLTDVIITDEEFDKPIGTAAEGSVTVLWAIDEIEGPQGKEELPICARITVICPTVDFTLPPRVDQSYTVANRDGFYRALHCFMDHGTLRYHTDGGEISVDGATDLNFQALDFHVAGLSPEEKDVS